MPATPAQPQPLATHTTQVAGIPNKPQVFPISQSLTGTLEPSTKKHAFLRCDNQPCGISQAETDFAHSIVISKAHWRELCLEVPEGLFLVKSGLLWIELTSSTVLDGWVPDRDLDPVPDTPWP